MQAMVIISLAPVESGEYHDRYGMLARIVVSTMSLTGDWRRRQTSNPVEVWRPEREYEGDLLSS